MVSLPLRSGPNFIVFSCTLTRCLLFDLVGAIRGKIVRCGRGVGELGGDERDERPSTARQVGSVYWYDDNTCLYDHRTGLGELKDTLWTDPELREPKESDIAYN